MAVTQLTKYEQKRLEAEALKKKVDLLEKELSDLIDSLEATKIKIDLKRDELLEVQGKHPMQFSDQVFVGKLAKKWKK